MLMWTILATVVLVWLCSGPGGLGQGLHLGIARAGQQPRDTAAPSQAQGVPRRSCRHFRPKDWSSYVRFRPRCSENGWRFWSSVCFAPCRSCSFRVIWNVRSSGSRPSCTAKRFPGRCCQPEWLTWNAWRQRPSAPWGGDVVSPCLTDFAPIVRNTKAGWRRSIRPWQPGRLANAPRTSGTPCCAGFKRHWTH